jgi:dihydroorotate dehydrogenase
MRLRGIEFGSITGASGVQGFFGEGYRTHRLLGPFGPDFRGMGLTAKTTTLFANKGFMPLRDDFTPVRLLPDCVVANFRKGVVLNSVGLSGPGAIALFTRGEWQKREDPFFISFMSLAKTKAERLADLREFVGVFLRFLPHFRAKVGLQLNFSCPNVGVHGAYLDLVAEVEEALAIAAVLGIPLVPKFNLNLSVAAAKRISDHPECDALCIANTIPWDDLPEAERLEYFGSITSPLEAKGYGKGGVSGRPLLPRLVRWIMDYQIAGGTKPLNAGGGILEASDAQIVLATAPGNSSVFLGSVAIVRPWRVGSIIRHVHRIAPQIERHRALRAGA